MKNPKFTKNRIVAAYAVAGIADLIEFPITYIESFHFEFTHLFGEFADIMVDSIVFAVMTGLLGFNWIWLPSFLVEAVPELDMCPTWVACVAYVIWKQKKEEEEQPQPSASLTAQDVHTLEIVNEPATASRREPMPLLALPENTAHAPTPPDSAIENRLKSLADLHDKNLISLNEYETKRQQILCEI